MAPQSRSDSIELRFAFSVRPWRIGGARSPKWKWGLLLPGAPEPRLPLLRRQDFRSVFQTALRGLSNRSIVVVGNYEFGPITSEPSRAKARPLRPRRSYFAPTEARLSLRVWVEAPGTAPGSEGFIATAVYRHSRLAPASPIYAWKVDEKRARRTRRGVVWRGEQPDSRGYTPLR